MRHRLELIALFPLVVLGITADIALDVFVPLAIIVAIVFALRLFA